MSRPSRCRKTVNYSDFMDDDDEDFATVRAPPNKKHRASVKELHHETNMETTHPVIETGGVTSEESRKRVSVDEKLYKRDLEAALSLSLLQSTETVEPLNHIPVEEDQPPVLTHCDVASSVYPQEDIPPVLSNCSVDVSHLDLNAVRSCTDSESDADFSDPDEESEDEEYTVKKKVEKKKSSNKEKKTMPNIVTAKSTPKLPKGKPQSTVRKKVLSHSPAVAQSVLKKTPIAPPTSKPVLCSSPPTAGRLPKWNPPGIVGSSPNSPSAQVKSPGLGLRIGLSRLARIKPLHPNAAAH